MKTFDKREFVIILDEGLESEVSTTLGSFIKANEDGGDSWTSVITIAVNRNNGEADVQTIYSFVEQIAPDKVKANPHWREKIRQKLQYHFTRISKGRYTNTTK